MRKLLIISLSLFILTGCATKSISDTNNTQINSEEPVETSTTETIVESTPKTEYIFDEAESNSIEYNEQTYNYQVVVSADDCFVTGGCVIATIVFLPAENHLIDIFSDYENDWPEIAQQLWDKEILISEDYGAFFMRVVDKDRFCQSNEYGISDENAKACNLLGYDIESNNYDYLASVYSSGINISWQWYNKGNVIYIMNTPDSTDKYTYDMGKTYIPTDSCLSYSSDMYLPDGSYIHSFSSQEADPSDPLGGCNTEYQIFNSNGEQVK